MRIAVTIAALAAATPAMGDPMSVLSDMPCADAVAYIDAPGADMMEWVTTLSGIAGYMMAVQDLAPHVSGDYPTVMDRIRAECAGRPAIDMLRQWAAE